MSLSKSFQIGPHAGTKTSRDYALFGTPPGGKMKLPGSGGGSPPPPKPVTKPSKPSTPVAKAPKPGKVGKLPDGSSPHPK